MLRAEELVWEAMAAYPTSASVHAELTELLLSRGQVQDAEFHRWLAQSGLVSPTLRASVVEARLLMDEEDNVAAAILLEEALGSRPRSYELVALSAEVRRRQNDPEAALILLQERMRRLQEHPLMMATEARVLSDLGEDQRARRHLDRALALYPRDAAVLAVAADLGG